MKAINKTTDLIPIHVNEIRTFAEKLKASFSGLVDAAKALVSMIDRDPKVIDQIHKMYPEFSFRFLGCIERVGRGVMRPELLYDDSPASKYLADCNYEVQKEAYENQVDVVMLDGDKAISERKAVQNLTKEECKLVFAGGRILNSVEQSKILKSKLIVTSFNPAQRYEFTDRGTIVWMKETELTWAQYEAIGEKFKDVTLKNLEKSMKQKQVGK